jgi:adenine-specific DNA-methyltransferase
VSSANSVDIFHPQSDKVRASNTDYNKESFFVRHAYFPGASDSCKSLKTVLKAEIDTDAWESLYSAISLTFDRSQSGHIAIKVINRLGNEAMKVFSVA